MAYSREQQHVIRAIRSGARRHGATRKEELAAYMTGAVESNFRNLNYGDADSKGWRQERQQFYKNPTNLRASVDRFFTETKAERGNYRTPAELAQAVQRSAFPERYAERRGEALNLYRGSRGRANTTSTVRIPGVDNSAQRQQVMQGYLSQRGRPGALLDLAAGLEGAQDIPTTFRNGGPNERLGRVAGDGTPINQMLRRAEGWERKKVPYQWGGGHGSIAKPGQPVDCSGYVSAILGLKTPLTSGGFLSWGNPGRGKNVTVWTNQGHVIVNIGKRWYGTSKSNPGGGAGRISPPSRDYLSRFTPRHP